MLSREVTLFVRWVSGWPGWFGERNNELPKCQLYIYPFHSSPRFKAVSVKKVFSTALFYLFLRMFFHIRWKKKYSLFGGKGRITYSGGKERFLFGGERSNTQSVKKEYFYRWIREYYLFGGKSSTRFLLENRRTSP